MRQRHFIRVENVVTNPGAAPEWRQHGRQSFCSCGWKSNPLLGDAADRVVREQAEHHRSRFLAPADDWIAR